MGAIFMGRCAGGAATKTTAHALHGVLSGEQHTVGATSCWVNAAFFRGWTAAMITVFWGSGFLLVKMIPRL